MPGRSSSLAVAVAFATSLYARAAAGGQSFDPYRVPKDQVLASVHTVAVMPLRLDPDARVAGEIAARIEGMVVDTLRRNGFTVVPPADFEKVWRTNSALLGGIYDPALGDPDPQKFKACLEHTARELGVRSRVDAIASASVLMDSQAGLFYARGVDAEAYWYGWPIMLHGRHLTSQFPEQLQRVEGSWFNFVLYDPAGATLYGIRYPIEWRRIYWRRGYDDRDGPPFSDTERTQKAVDSALESLAQPSSGASTH